MWRGDFYQPQSGDVMPPIRQHYNGALIGNMGYNDEEADRDISAGKFDGLAFGNSFLVNLDLPIRIKMGAALNQLNPETS